MRLTLTLCLFAGPVLAQETLPDFMGAYGCTFGEDSHAAAIVARFSEVDIDDLIEGAVNRGAAQQQGEYVVLGRDICTIRLPDIESPIAIDSPEIQTVAPYIVDRFEDDGEVSVTEGCFLRGEFDLFIKLNGGDEEAGFTDYVNFLGAGVISGEARFYAPNPLATPMGFQITTGDCAAAPNIAEITSNHQFVASGFDDYVRFAGENTLCGNVISSRIPSFVAQLQGYDETLTSSGDQPEINAWLFFEYDIITWAAGWYEGQGATGRGKPRPPLCHFPDQ